MAKSIQHGQRRGLRGGRSVPRRRRAEVIRRPPVLPVADDPAPDATPSLFGGAPAPRVVRRYGTDLFGKAILKEAVEMLPLLPDTESVQEIRVFLRSQLHFSAVQTRERNANYITRRMFPDGIADAPVRCFARAFAESKELREVCFYRFLRAEPLQVRIVDELLLPAVGAGRLSRARLRAWLASEYPASRSINDCAKAAVDALTAGGIATADRTEIRFAGRDIPLASFAFILHSEFPEPGMYDIGRLEQNRFIRAMLWNPDRLVPALYELRNRGLISKVSEIDNIRQFTTRYTLGEVVEKIGERKKG